jgi:undecaprenyl-diphosphatase
MIQNLPFKLKTYVPYGILAGAILLLILLIGPLKPVDDAIASSIMSLPSNWRPVMQAISDLASTTGITVIVTLWGFIHVMIKRWQQALIVLSSLIVAPIYVTLKHLVGRARPTALTVELGFGGDSFPSGHSAASCAVFLVIAYLLYRELPKKWAYLVLATAVTLVVAVGMSRIYLEAHHPTDVLGGWMVAGIGLLVARAVANYYQSHGTKKV